MIPRLVIAGTSSGAGKTTVAVGLLAALAARGVRATGFKVGPDFIDPSYHALASGRPGRNLDAFLSGPELIAPLFRHGSAGAEVAIVEGVMGLFDGASGRGELASTAHVAKLLRAPIVLVVDAAAMARSVAAIVHGYATFDPDVDVAGVILNRVGSPWHVELLREALAPLEVPVLGALPREEAIATPERHLGLVPVAEREPRAREAIATLAAAVAAGCDLDAVLALARRVPELPGEPWRPDPPSSGSGGPSRLRARIAVAGGPAFSFHYTENLELLEAAGRRARDLRPARRRGAAAPHRRAAAGRRIPRGVRRRAVGQLGAARGDRRLRPPRAAESSPSAAACSTWPRSSTAARCATSSPSRPA